MRRNAENRNGTAKKEDAPKRNRFEMNGSEMEMHSRDLTRNGIEPLRLELLRNCIAWQGSGNEKKCVELEKRGLAQMWNCSEPIRTD